MTPPTPILILINTFAILQTRKKKHMKLVIMKEKSIARRAERGPQDQEADNSKNMILWELNGSKFSDITSEKEENDDRESFDSEPYYAFDDGEQQLRITGNPKIKEINLFNFKEVLDSLIIVDFNGHVEQRPMINVLPPVAEPPKPLVVRKVSREVQTIPVKVIDPNQIIQKKAEVQKQVQIPKLNREPQLGFKSDLGKKNILLTESIESAHRKEQKQKTKANTFMDYYNSQPVKASSNILEKYIKRKK